MADVNVNTLGTFISRVIGATRLEGGNTGPGIGRPVVVRAYDPSSGTFDATLSSNGSAATVNLTSSASTIGIAGVSATPSADSDVTNKKYVDDTVKALPLKMTARAATVSSLYSVSPYTVSGINLIATANVTLATYASVFDGVTLLVGDRVLLRLETGHEVSNGLYTVTALGSGSAPWVLTRAPDMDTSAKALKGSIVYLSEGSTLALYGFMLVTGNVTLNVTPLTFNQMLLQGGGGGGGSVTAGNGISVTGSTVSVLPAARLTFNSGALIVGSSSTAGDVLCSSGTTTTEPTYSSQFGPTAAADITNKQKLAGVNAVSSRATDGSIAGGGLVMRATSALTTAGQYGPAFYLGDPDVDGSARLVMRGDGTSANLRLEQRKVGTWTPMCEISV